MTEPVKYDVAIVGGGLAGLALCIQLKRKGHSVLLIEKETYPFHKVCGEYISMESWHFLETLGVNLTAMQVPVIRQLNISSAGGKLLKHPLSQGGFGISRYLLDSTLTQIARAAGVLLLENSKVNDIVFDQDEFTIHCNAQQYRAKMACACFGKRSNMDVKWKRPFVLAPKNKINNYIGVKYHIKTPFPADTIALHHFKNGYCGIVKIEGDLYNLCYLSRADNLQQSQGNIKTMEEHILSQNPALKKILQQSETCFAAPLTISQISFDKKSQLENHVLMIGDAAGMITPLCGNGMSMALHGSKIAAFHIDDFLKGNISRLQMEQGYTRQWKKQFNRRLQNGRRIQYLFGSKGLSNCLLALLKPFPALVNFLVKQTHGKPF
ncbi:MAG: NAD(P)/FAD-dependent oxidoreductase [Chitinophagaceae bacterium]|nr:MAG: NAD(P)/FAD-dependent oxidoreductase [Chitinophagaceae bacterium]